MYRNRCKLSNLTQNCPPDAPNRQLMKTKWVGNSTSVCLSFEGKPCTEPPDGNLLLVLLQHRQGCPPVSPTDEACPWIRPERVKHIRAYAPSGWSISLDMLHHCGFGGVTHSGNANQQHAYTTRRVSQQGESTTHRVSQQCESTTHRVSQHGESTG